jgi:hypothetical protein
VGPAQVVRHRRAGRAEGEQGDQEDGELDVVAGEECDQEGEGVGEVGEEVGEEGDAVAAVPVEEQVAGSVAVQQVPEVGVEGDELVAQVVDRPRPSAEGVRAVQGLGQAVRGHGQPGGERGGP